jgi:hypothetical protein
MDLSKTVTRYTVKVLLAFFISISCFIPMGQAAMIGTQQIINHEQAQTDRAHLNTLLSRADLAAQLGAAGVDPAQLQSRIASLSDEEVTILNQRLDQLPAGSGIIGTAALIFLVLLLTDILGYTNVYPFVKKTVN